MKNNPPAAAVINPTIAKVVLYPANGDVIEIPGSEVANCGLEAGTVQVVQQSKDGTIRRWINVPMMIEVAPPSPILRPVGS